MNRQTFKCGDIYLIDFDPSVGHEYKKQRPAIIIQATETLTRSHLVTIMPLTSQVNKKLPEDILVCKDLKNQLFSNSVIKVHSIVSFDESRFIKKIGVLSHEIINQVKKYLRIHFEL